MRFVLIIAVMTQCFLAHLAMETLFENEEEPTFVDTDREISPTLTILHKNMFHKSKRLTHSFRKIMAQKVKARENLKLNEAVLKRKQEKNEEIKKIVHEALGRMNITSFLNDFLTMRY